MSLKKTPVPREFRRQTWFLVPRCDVQHFSTPVQLHHGPKGCGIRYVRGFRESSQYARIDQVGHYSYSPSLLRASCGGETPQFVPVWMTNRSHSSLGSTIRRRALSRSRKTSRARISGATPRLRAISLSALSNSGGSVMTMLISPRMAVLATQAIQLDSTRKQQGWSRFVAASDALIVLVGPPRKVPRNRVWRLQECLGIVQPGGVPGTPYLTAFGEFRGHHT